MTTTEAAVQGRHAGEPEPRSRGSLLRAEVHRITARRFIRLLLGLAVAGFVAGIAVATTQYAPAGAEQLDAARAQLQTQYEQCVATQEIPPGEERNYCGDPTDEEQLQFYLDKSPFVLSTDLPDGIVAIGVLSAALAFLVGATYVGAEWSSRSMVALLFWEPRRMRVLAVKAAVMALAGLAIGAAGQLLWHLGAQLLARTRGTTSGLPEGFWGDVLAGHGRAVLLTTLIGLLGFALANLIRNTGAALGVAFVYFVVIENAIRGLRPRWAEYLVADNAAALVTEGGSTIYVNENVVENGQVTFTDVQIQLSNLHGAVVLGVVTLAVLALGTLLFQRRDLH